MLEIELKFAVNEAATANGTRALRTLLAELAGQQQPRRLETDAYFNHPSRDFVQTDEALRVRSWKLLDETPQVQRCCLTYKGPRLDAATKMREEIETVLADGQENSLRATLVLLGFRHVRDVEKIREPWRLQFLNRHFEVVFDTVTSVGQYVEIETLADPADRDGARGAVLQLAARLGLTQPEHRGYLRMLLERDAKMS